MATQNFLKSPQITSDNISESIFTILDIPFFDASKTKSPNNFQVVTETGSTKYITYGGKKSNEVWNICTLKYKRGQNEQDD